MPQSHLAPFTSFHRAAHRVCFPCIWCMVHACTLTCCTPVRDKDMGTVRGSSGRDPLLHECTSCVLLGPQPPPVFPPSTVTGSRHCITDCVSPGAMQCRPQLGRGQSDTPGSGVPFCVVCQNVETPGKHVKFLMSKFYVDLFSVFSFLGFGKEANSLRKASVS